MDSQGGAHAAGAGTAVEGPALPPSAVAARLGVAAATLRTWDRRYGLGPSVRTAGAHRRYGPQDVARLQVMRRLVLDGVPAAEAARVARSALPHLPAARALSASSDGASSGCDGVASGAAAEAVRAAPAGGGAVLPVGDVADPVARAAARGLARAAQALDAEAVVAGVRAQLRERGVVAAWDQVLRPVLRAVGDRWAATGEGVEVEHLLARCAAVALHEHADDVRRALAPDARIPRPALLAAAPDEQHELPLHAVAAALAERAVPSRLLGGSTPPAALLAAVRRTRACAVVVWAQVEATADARLLAQVPSTRPPTLLVAAGPGWSAPLPAGVQPVDGLAAAVAAVTAAAGRADGVPGAGPRR